mgnify:CR=1 FL=1
MAEFIYQMYKARKAVGDLLERLKIIAAKL